MSSPDETELWWKVAEEAMRRGRPLEQALLVADRVYLARCRHPQAYDRPGLRHCEGPPSVSLETEEAGRIRRG